jgi:hypothetical protein
LAASAATVSDRRQRNRSARQARTSAVRRAGSLAGVGALAGYFETHLRYLAPIAVLAAALAGWHFAARYLPALEAGSGAPAKYLPVPPRRPVTADTGQHPRIVPDASNTRKDESAPATGKAAVRGAALVATRDPTLDRWFVNSYLRCWVPPKTLPPGERYSAQIRIAHNPDGSIASAPVLVNPPSNPEWRAFADSAVRAVTACNPLQVPPQYLDRFDQWKKMSLHFSPDNAAE